MRYAATDGDTVVLQQLQYRQRSRKEVILVKKLIRDVDEGYIAYHLHQRLASG
jgi:hypothetical protein